MKPKAIQIISNRLYWIADVKPPTNISDSFYFNIDKDLEYEPFYMDFGPLSLGKTWKYVSELEKLITHANYKKNKIYHYTSIQNQKSANAAYLMGAFEIIILGYSAEAAFEPFKSIPFKPFRDASYNKNCSYKCTLLDCLQGLQYAIKLGWFNYKKFNLNQYQHFERVENGDLNWIIPNKFVAFSSPYDSCTDRYGNRVFTPADYVPIFKKLGVKMVIRLNNLTYDARGFTNEGIKHHDLIFTDGTAPEPHIVDKFLELAESQKGAIAVHCKAGLGRTGCLIACYAIKHYRFPAADFIGWIRIARPGSILGPQQNFLVEIQQQMRIKGENSEIWNQIKGSIEQKQIISKMKKLILKNDEQMNERQKQISKNGEIGQGEYLVEAKMRKQRNSILPNVILSRISDKKMNEAIYHEHFSLYSLKIVFFDLLFFGITFLIDAICFLINQQKFIFQKVLFLLIIFQKIQKLEEKFAKTACQPS